MEAFAAELSEAINDLEDRDLSCKPPSPTTDKIVGECIELNAAQGTQIQGRPGLELKMRSMRVRLDKLSRFRIHTDAIYFPSSEPHGCGGKAEVVKAILKQGGGGDEQQVAVKKLRYYDDIDERKFGNEFVHEVDVMAQLSHKNIIKLIGFVEDLQEGKAWIVLSWEPNGNLSEFLATGEYEIPERISLIQDTFAGIEYLHTRQPPICHGDLKSLNILVSAKYQAVITDFGSARVMKETEDNREDRDKARDATGASAIARATGEQIDHTQITIVASTNQLTLTGPAWSLRWAAPEVALGEPQSLASDVWAAGWICWEAMTNKVPFPELNSEGTIVLRVMEGHVPAVREDTQLSQIVSLCSLMTDCWEFDPRDRPNITQCNKKVQWMASVSPSGRKASGSNTLSAELSYQMGFMHRAQGSFKEAIALFQRALSMAKSEGNQDVSQRALSGLGSAFYLTSRLTEAEEHLTRAKDIGSPSVGGFNQADALFWLAAVYRAQGKLSQAEESYIQARQIFSRIGHDQGQADTLRGLGSIFHRRLQFPEAEEFYCQARDILARIGDDQGHANTLRRLGILYHDRSEYSMAKELFNQALGIYSRMGDNSGRANVYWDLGYLYHVQGLNSQAAPLFAEARSLYALVGDIEAEKDSSNWLDVVSKEEDPSAASLSVHGIHDVPPPAQEQ